MKWKGYDNSFDSWMDKKNILWVTEYFLERQSSLGRVKVKLDLSNYAAKADLKNAIGVDTPKLAKKVDLAGSKSNVDKLDIDKLKDVSSNLNNWKSKVDKLDVDKLVPVPVYLSKLSGAVKKMLLKKMFRSKMLKIKYLILI